MRLMFVLFIQKQMSGMKMRLESVAKVGGDPDWINPMMSPLFLQDIFTTLGLIKKLGQQHFKVSHNY